MKQINVKSLSGFAILGSKLWVLVMEEIIQRINNSTVSFGYEELLEALPFPGFIIDKNGVKTYQNRSSLLAWGNLLGKQLSDIVESPEDLERMLKEDAWVLEHQERLIVHDDIFCLNGVELKYAKYLMPIQRRNHGNVHP